MNKEKHLFDTIVKQLELGKTLKQAVLMHGGALHKMWKVTTDRGAFAIKDINSHIVQKISFPDSYEVAETIAAHFKNEGVPAISAINIHGRFVHQIDNHGYLVYPYVDGSLGDFTKLDKYQLQMIGSIFATMHDLGLTIECVEHSHYDYFDDVYWKELVDASNNRALQKCLGFLLHCNQQFNNAMETLKSRQVITHRDMHSLNVLWDDKKQPHVIDWETAGLMNPILEVVGYGIEWGGIIQGEFKKNNTQQLLRQYRTVFKQPINEQEIKHAFYGWIGHCIMGWTEFNIRRMMEKTSQDKQEQQIGHDIINHKMLRCLQYLSKHEKRLLELVSEALI